MRFVLPRYMTGQSVPILLLFLHFLYFPLVPICQKMRLHLLSHLVASMMQKNKLNSWCKYSIYYCYIILYIKNDIVMAISRYLVHCCILHSASIQAVHTFCCIQMFVMFVVWSLFICFVFLIAQHYYKHKNIGVASVTGF